MRKDFDGEFRKRVNELTGLTGETLDYITGIIYATAFIGELPSKEDLATYLGVRNRTVDDVIAQGIRTCVPDQATERTPYEKWIGVDLVRPRPVAAEFIYPLATKLISDGLYLDTKEESMTRFIARSFLETFLVPQRIKTKDLFIGYNIMLEYLWQVVESGEVQGIERFVEVRYERINKSLRKTEEFCKQVYDTNLHIFDDPDLIQVTEYLATHALEAMSRCQANGSAKLAKQRIKKFRELDKENSQPTHPDAS